MNGRKQEEECWVTRALAAGAVAGVAGGVALSVAAVLLARAGGQSVWPALQAPSYPLLGVLALSPRPVPLALLLGTALHFAVAAAWGALFGVAVEGQPRGRLPALGVIWGAAVFVLMYGLVLNLIGAHTLVAMVSLRRALAEHALYGLVVGLSYLPLARERSAQRADEPDAAFNRRTPMALSLP